MKNTVNTMVLTCAIALTFGITGFSASHAADVERGYVSVFAQASEEATPNMAKVTLSVETSDKDITKVSEANKQAANNSIQAVKKLLDTSNGETVKTLAFNVNPEYRYKDGQRIFIQYTARNSFEVKIKDITKLGKIISAALSNGANVVSNLSYALDTDEEACNKLIRTASSYAKAKADNAANALGTSVTGIKYANIQCSTNESIQPRYNMSLKSAGNAMAMEDAAAVPTEGGTIKFRATVDASFFVK